MDFTNLGHTFALLRQAFTPEQTQALLLAFGKLPNSNIPHVTEEYPHLTREQLRELENLAVERYGLPGIVLMENAGREAAKIIAALTSGPVLILCGRGNNGGDGFVVARHLYNWGIPVMVMIIGSLNNIDPGTEAGIALDIIQRMKISMCEVQDMAALKTAWPTTPEPEVIVDAIFGTGLNGIVKEPYLNIIQELPKCRRPIISLDIPSGLDSNTGDILGAAINANLTITFGYPKWGFVLRYGPRCTGKVVVVDIGIPRDLLETISTNE